MWSCDGASMVPIFDTVGPLATGQELLAEAMTSGISVQLYGTDVQGFVYLSFAGV